MTENWILAILWIAVVINVDGSKCVCRKEQK